jgi:hypothetical protein
MIYSVILRYHLASPNIRASYTKEELFSNKITAIRTDFFPYAVMLEERLKHFSFYSSIKIIKNLTFYEYFIKFLSQDDFNKLEDLLINKRAGQDMCNKKAWQTAMSYIPSNSISLVSATKNSDSFGRP